MRNKITFLLLLVVLTLTGCATTVSYLSYTGQKFIPKPKDYSVTVYPSTEKLDPALSYVVIGKVNISGHVSDGVAPNDLNQQARAIARKKGADAIMNVKTQELNYEGVYTVPSHVTYHPIVVEGRHHRESVAYVERYHPKRYIPYSDEVLTFEGELIVYTPDFHNTNK
jgi:hypothetical protein